MAWRLKRQTRSIIWRQQISDRAGEDADILIADTRYGHAHTLAQTVVRTQGKVTRTLSDSIDRVVLGRWTGIPSVPGHHVPDVLIHHKCRWRLCRFL